MSKTILGIDLGSNSLGWALLSADDDGKPTDIIEKTQDAFKYKTGRNSGEFTLHKREINKQMKQTQFGTLKGAYEKKVDFRNFEYEIADGVILRDNFDFVKKKPANILPVRDNCKLYLKRFKLLFNL